MNVPQISIDELPPVRLTVYAGLGIPSNVHINFNLVRKPVTAREAKEMRREVVHALKRFASLESQGKVSS